LIFSSVLSRLLRTKADSALNRHFSWKLKHWPSCEPGGHGKLGRREEQLS